MQTGSKSDLTAHIGMAVAASASEDLFLALSAVGCSCCDL